MSYCVYCHTNIENGKRYIGITSTSVNKRWQNGNGYKNNRYFSAAINKYGWDGFKHEIIATGLDKNGAEEKEIELIRKFKTTDRDYGYNISNGGESRGKQSEETREILSKLAKERYTHEKNPMFNRHHTEETKKKMSDALKGRVIDEAWREKLSQAGKGRVLSEETRRKLSKALKGKPCKLKGVPRTEETKHKISEANKKKVVCLNDNKEFSCITDASVFYGVDASAIGKICKGKKKSIKGLYFVFAKG